MKKGLTVLFFLLFTDRLSVSAQQLIFKTYTVQDGLVANPVRKILQDSKGFIWIITWEGISKYDGHQFTNFTTATGLSFNLVNDIYETKEGKLIVAENDGNTDIIQDDAVIQKAVLQNTIINKFVLTGNGKVIACTDENGFFELNEERLTKPRQTLARSTFYDLVTWNDSLIVGFGEALHILNNRYEMLATFNKPGVSFYDVYTDSRNRLWAGTSDGLKLFVFSVQNRKEVKPSALPNYFNIPLLSTGAITSILEDVAGVFWIGTVNGVVRLEPDGNWQLYSDKDGLPSRHIECIFQDREKNIWIGTSLGIAKIVTRNNLQIITTQQGLLGNAVPDFYRLNKDQMLIVSGSGVQLYDDSKKSFTQTKIKNGAGFSGFIKQSPVPLFYNQNSNLGGRYNFISNSIEEIPLIKMYAAVRDTRGFYFSGTFNGLFFISGKKIHAFGPLPYRINNLLIDKTGGLWAGTWENGLYRIQYTVSKDIDAAVVKDITALLPGESIRSLFEDSNGNIWVGTRYNGVICFRFRDGKNYDVQQWDSRHGLLADWIATVAEDSTGNIWLGSNLGIDKLVRQDTGFHIFNFSRINNFYAPINAISPYGSTQLLMATSLGLLCIEDEQMEDLPPLPVYITSVVLGLKKNNFTPLRPEQNTSLSYRQNQAQFGFSSPGFINEKQILYSYRLSGSEDTTWSKPANVHSVSYASLQAGRYRFEARALGWNGRYGAPAFFDFTIRPPFWKTGWFFSLSLLLIILCVYLVYRYRINQLVKFQQVRSRIAADLHDEIGSTLTNINILTELSKKNIDRRKEAEVFLSRIAEEASMSGQALDDIVWSINNDNDTIEQTVARMRRYAAEVFESCQISHSLLADDHIGGKKLDMELRRDFFLMFKETVTNICKHAKATHAEISIRIEKKNLILHISDNGNGFDPAAPTHRNGIKGIQTRVKKWKGHTDIRSTPGKGATIHISLPLS